MNTIPLSNFSPIDNKEMLLLNIAKSNLEIVDNTHSQPQETLEFKMNKQKESFSFDQPIDLPDKWMMGVTSLEVYNTVYNITEMNNEFMIVLAEEGSWLVEVSNKYIEYTREKRSEDFPKALELIEISKEEDVDRSQLINALKEQYEEASVDDFHFIQFLRDQKFSEEEIISITGIRESIKPTETEFSKLTNNISIGGNKLRVRLNPGIYELVDINNSIKELLLNLVDFEGPEVSIVADTISMRSILTTTHPIIFSSTLNSLLGFIKTDYPPGNHRSEKPAMITSIDKVHLKTDCVDGSIVNGIRESILFSFNLSAPPGYKIFKEPTTILYKKINRTKLDRISFYLEDTNHNPVDFNGESLTFTVQIIKI